MVKKNNTECSSRDHLLVASFVSAALRIRCHVRTLGQPGHILCRLPEVLLNLQNVLHQFIYFLIDFAHGLIWTKIRLIRIRSFANRVKGHAQQTRAHSESFQRMSKSAD